MWGSVREGAGLLESSPSRHRDAAVVSQARGVTGLVRLKPTPTRHSDATRLVVKEEILPVREGGRGGVCLLCLDPGLGFGSAP
jgi:hypothetical protein